jgi:hypothetical protein
MEMKNPTSEVPYINLQAFLQQETVSCPASSIGRGKSLRFLIRVSAYGRALYDVEKDKKVILSTHDPVEAVETYNRELEEHMNVKRVLRYTKGDVVQYRGRIQTSECGHRIEAIDRSNESAPYCVEGKWWGERNLMPFEEWYAEFRANK